MTSTEQFIHRLAKLGSGELSLLRRSAGKPLDASVPAFDLFTGLWWPLRARNQRMPQRWCAWLVAKLYGSYPLSRNGPPLAAAVGAAEPRLAPATGKLDTRDRSRYRMRFDALLTSPAVDLALEPHLRWSLKRITDRRHHAATICWALLLDDLWRWCRPPNQRDTWDTSRWRTHERSCGCRQVHQTIQEVWACEYINSSQEVAHER